MFKIILIFFVAVVSAGNYHGQGYNSQITHGTGSNSNYGIHNGYNTQRFPDPPKPDRNHHNQRMTHGTGVFGNFGRHYGYNKYNDYVASYQGYAPPIKYQHPTETVANSVNYGAFANSNDPYDVSYNFDHTAPGNMDEFLGLKQQYRGKGRKTIAANGYFYPELVDKEEKNWDDQLDGYFCAACGGKGCKVCTGYGHLHTGAKFGYHGHNLKNGFGVGHHHKYLGKKP
jgi:hypothetical protein